MYISRKTLTENTHKTDQTGPALLVQYDKLTADRRTTEAQLANLDRQIAEVRASLLASLGSAPSIESNGHSNGANGRADGASGYGVAFAKVEKSKTAAGASATLKDSINARLEDCDPRMRRSLPEILEFIETAPERRASVAEIRTHLGISANAARARITTALKHKLVRKVGKGKFAPA